MRDGAFSSWPAVLSALALGAPLACVTPDPAPGAPPLALASAEGAEGAALREEKTMSETLEAAADRERILDLARACAEAEPYRGRGIHGTPLVYEEAIVDTPAAARTRGDGGSLAELGDEYRLVAIPESPPMNLRIPNGRNLLVNTETGSCKALKMR